VIVAPGERKAVLDPHDVGHLLVALPVQPLDHLAGELAGVPYVHHRRPVGCQLRRPVDPVVVLDFAQARLVLVDAGLPAPGGIVLDPVGWVADDHCRRAALQRLGDDQRIPAVAAHQAVLAQHPDLPRGGAPLGLQLVLAIRQVAGVVALGRRHQRGQQLLQPGVRPRRQHGQLGILGLHPGDERRQLIFVGIALAGQLVVRGEVRLDLGCGPVGRDDVGRQLGQAFGAGRLDDTVAGDDQVAPGAVVLHDDRAHLSEAPQGHAQVGDLFRFVTVVIMRMWPQQVDGDRLGDHLPVRLIFFINASYSGVPGL